MARLQPIFSMKGKELSTVQGRAGFMYRATYCARNGPLPLLPSGPGGVGGIVSRRTRHFQILPLTRPGSKARHRRFTGALMACRAIVAISDEPFGLDRTPTCCCFKLCHCEMQR